jgi:hypothetical protein
MPCICRRRPRLIMLNERENILSALREKPHSNRRRLTEHKSPAAGSEILDAKTRGQKSRPDEPLPKQTPPAETPRWSTRTSRASGSEPEPRYTLRHPGTDLP